MSNVPAVIDSFNGRFRFLSNFYEKDILVRGDDEPVTSWRSSEHLYQASKTLDKEEQTWVRLAKTPAEAKKRGRQITLRPDWDEVKDLAMLNILRLKFQDPDLRRMLLATGDAELIEGNWWGDTYWGVCKGQGQNMLGKALMLVRDEVRIEERRKSEASV